jgi:hypothetical protein
MNEARIASGFAALGARLSERGGYLPAISTFS